MQAWITPGVLDAIVAGVAVEFVALGAGLHRAGATRLLAPLFLHLASGACLLLALRASLSQEHASDVPLALLAALAAHVASLWISHRSCIRPHRTMRFGRPRSLFR